MRLLSQHPFIAVLLGVAFVLDLESILTESGIPLQHVAKPLPTAPGYCQLRLTRAALKRTMMQELLNGRTPLL